MENLSDSNMFSVAGEEILASYTSHLCGAGECAKSTGDVGNAGGTDSTCSSGGAGCACGAGDASDTSGADGASGASDAGNTSDSSNARCSTIYVAPQSAECLFLSFSETELSKTAKSALTKTAESFGIPAKKCLFATCTSASDNHSNNACCSSSDSSCANEDTLSEKDIFAIVEGLDPKMLIICDNTTCELALAAYTSKTYTPVLPLEKRARLFGRRCVAFSSFESLLDSPENKQRAWSALKTLRD